MKLKFGMNKPVVLTVIGLIAAGVAGWYFYYGQSAKAEDYISGKIERGNIRNTVAATGTLQAVTTVQVGSQVSGTILALHADFNSIVRKGQVVAQLDPAIFQAQVSQQRANVEQAKANLVDAKARVLAAEAMVTTQRAGVGSAVANLAALKATRDDSAKLLERQQALARSGVIAERDLESARANFNAAEARHQQAAAQLEQARSTEQSAASAGLAQAKAQVQQSMAQLKQTEAALKLAEVNLSHATISSPIDGVVVSRNVDVGQTVAASLSAPTLFTIANDLTQMQVIANIDQADIGVINDKNNVNFTVDAFPGQNFHGAINQIRLNPQNVQNVVTYNVVIDVKNPDLKLKPGMTANLTFTIAERNNVLKLPNAALRFRPQDITQDKIREMMRGSGEAGGPKRQEGAAPDASPGALPAASPGAGKDGKRGPRQGKDRPAGAESKDQAKSPDGGSGERGERGQQGEHAERGAHGERGAPGSKDTKAANDAGGARREGASRYTGMVPSTTASIEGQWRIVWVLGPDKKPQPRRIQIGITDGISTEILETDLKEGETIIVAQNITSASRTQSTQAPPGFGGGFGGGRPGGGAPGGGGGGGGRR